MTRYHVELVSIDPKDDSRDTLFSTYVEAVDEAEARASALEIQSKDQPDLRPQDTWSWFIYETAERGGDT